MTRPTLQPQVDQITLLIHDLVRLQPRLQTILPDHAAQVKPELSGLAHDPHVSGYGLFYRVGVLLYHQKEPMTMGELAKALGVPLSTATRMVDWMVTNGYIERLQDTEDRRVVRVRLTDSAMHLHPTMDAFVKQRIEQILQLYTADERRQLIRLLRKAVVALEKMDQ